MPLEGPFRPEMALLMEQQDGGGEGFDRPQARVRVRDDQPDLPCDQCDPGSSTRPALRRWMPGPAVPPTRPGGRGWWPHAGPWVPGRCCRSPLSAHLMTGLASDAQTSRDQQDPSVLGWPPGWSACRPGAAPCAVRPRSDHHCDGGTRRPYRAAPRSGLRAHCRDSPASPSSA